ncbi:hypothetical protein BJ742DRAFT_827700 [Cladochytrium replicatum]|nr:hypothetical protein BJ742DRAFT_827700 [Cladochytrium replicatum]
MLPPVSSLQRREATVHDLSEDTWLYIITLLAKSDPNALQSLHNLQQVNRWFRRVCSDNKVWYHAYCSRYPMLSSATRYLSNSPVHQSPARWRTKLMVAERANQSWRQYGRGASPPTTLILSAEKIIEYVKTIFSSPRTLSDAIAQKTVSASADPTPTSSPGPASYVITSINPDHEYNLPSLSNAPRRSDRTLLGVSLVHSIPPDEISDSVQPDIDVDRHLNLWSPNLVRSTFLFVDLDQQVPGELPFCISHSTIAFRSSWPAEPHDCWLALRHLDARRNLFVVALENEQMQRWAALYFCRMGEWEPWSMVDVHSPVRGTRAEARPKETVIMSTYTLPENLLGYSVLPYPSDSTVYSNHESKHLALILAVSDDLRGVIVTYSCKTGRSLMHKAYGTDVTMLDVAYGYPGGLEGSDTALVLTGHTRHRVGIWDFDTAAPLIWLECGSDIRYQWRSLSSCWWPNPPPDAHLDIDKVSTLAEFKKYLQQHPPGNEEEEDQEDDTDEGAVLGLAWLDDAENWIPGSEWMPMRTLSLVSFADLDDGMGGVFVVFDVDSALAEARSRLNNWISGLELLQHTQKVEQQEPESEDTSATSAVQMDLDHGRSPTPIDTIMADASESERQALPEQSSETQPHELPSTYTNGFVDDQTSVFPTSTRPSTSKQFQLGPICSGVGSTGPCTWSGRMRPTDTFHILAPDILPVLCDSRTVVRRHIVPTAESERQEHEYDEVASFYVIHPLLILLTIDGILETWDLESGERIACVSRQQKPTQIAPPPPPPPELPSSSSDVQNGFVTAEEADMAGVLASEQTDETGGGVVQDGDSESDDGNPLFTPVEEEVFAIYCVVRTPSGKVLQLVKEGVISLDFERS